MHTVCQVANVLAAEGGPCTVPANDLQNLLAQDSYGNVPGGMFEQVVVKDIHQARNFGCSIPGT
jgi:hypothetical protein